MVFNSADGSGSCTLSLLGNGAVTVVSGRPPRSRSISSSVNVRVRTRCKAGSFGVMVCAAICCSSIMASGRKLGCRLLFKGRETKRVTSAVEMMSGGVVFCCAISIKTISDGVVGASAGCSAVLASLSAAALSAEGSVAPTFSASACSAVPVGSFTVFSGAAALCACWLCRNQFSSHSFSCRCCQ